LVRQRPAMDPHSTECCAAMRGESIKGNAEGRAVVIGASIAGLCAARVSSDFYDRVTVLERDELLPTTLCIVAGADHKPTVARNILVGSCAISRMGPSSAATHAAAP